jgi:hypothetical protein
MISTKNPNAKAVNQARGPQTGNAGTPSKRQEFMSAKAKSGSERAELATMITDAVAARGRGMEGFRDKTVEGLHTNTNVGRGPTRGNAAKPQKSGGGRRGALGATSGY